MHRVPDCLNRRNQALDRLIKELCAPRSSNGQCSNDCGDKVAARLMHDFWDTLNDDPMSNLAAASFDKQCDAKITDLMNAQRELRDQIQNLEKRENAGIQMLKQADCMWTCMEDSYKKKVAESLERQKTLFQELKEVEASAGKWRKNKNDLEFQMKNIEKCEKEIKEKINQKSNDMKGINAEVDDFQKRVDKNKKEIEAANKSLTTKRQASDLKMTNLAADITFNQKKISEENKYKENKEKEGSGFVKDAREDLQKLCKVLLQKKIENEDLRAEKAALNLELDLLNKSHDACQNKCGQKQQSVLDEIKSIDKDISEFKVKCIRCHECTDTGDVRKYCTDCPRCLNERDCIYEDGVCKLDETMDCVCMNVKEKFLDNIFDNMCTVLERQGKTEQGRAVADAILKCLKKSRNGKLDASTRKLLQDFVLSTVKQHLNLTIIGGAVKTRCEMDPETYKQLMLCLKQVKVVGPTKEDKETDAKKETCRRWGGDCNCPKSGKGCVCDKIAPPMQPESAAGPKETSNPKEASNNDTCKVTFCPPKTSTCCGTDIMAQGVSSRVATEVSAFKQEPCRDSSCGYPKNMRAAQCVLGPEILNSPTRSSKPSMPSLPETPVLEGKFCKCSTPSIKSCSCRDLEQHPREKIIEEVMGRYIEVPVIDKVTAINETQLGEIRDSGNSVDQAIPRSVTSTNGQSSKFVSSEESDKIDEVQLESKQNVVKLIPKGDFKETPTRDFGANITTGVAILSNRSNFLKRTGSTEMWKNNLISTNLTPKDKTININGKLRESVESLINNVIVPDDEIAEIKNFMSQVEFVSVQSFVRRMEFLTKYGRDSLSNVTTDETEVETHSLQEFNYKYT